MYCGIICNQIIESYFIDKILTNKMNMKYIGQFIKKCTTKRLSNNVVTNSTVNVHSQREWDTWWTLSKINKWRMIGFIVSSLFRFNSIKFFSLESFEKYCLSKNTLKNMKQQIIVLYININSKILKHMLFSKMKNTLH